MALIQLHALNHWFDGKQGERVHALHDVSLCIEEGEFVCVTGPSGAGKSTLLNLLGCLDNTSSGSYRLHGREICGVSSDVLAVLRRRTFGFVFQSFNLLGAATVLENVEMPGCYAGLERAARRKRARALLANVGLEDHAERLATELSGGEQQRVAIARALINGGKVILADEPTRALDSRSAALVLDVFERLTEDGHTVVLATHSREIASRSPRCIELCNGQINNDSGKAVVPSRKGATRPPNHLTTGSVLKAIQIGLQSLLIRMRRHSRLGLILPTVGVALAVWLGCLALHLGEGIHARVVQSVNQVGMETITVMRSGKAGRDGSFKWLTRDDAIAIEMEIAGVRAVSPAKFWPNMQVSRGDAMVPLSVVGVVDRGTRRGRGDAGYRIAAGEPITPQDDESLERVAVLDAVARERLFPPGTDPVGQEIRVNGTPFQVKGVYEYRTGLLSGASEDEIREQEDILNSAVQLPFRTAYTLFAQDDRVYWIYVFLENPDQLFEVATAIRNLAIRRYGEEVYFVEHWGENLQQALRQRELMRLGLGSLAGIVLMAVNFSVMALMLNAIRARRGEIGIRMAIGARRRDIVWQFMTESFAISVVGGIMGFSIMLACIPVLNGIGFPSGLTPLIWAPLAIALLFGLVFSIVPARRAARLTPAAALAPE